MSKLVAEYIQNIRSVIWSPLQFFANEKNFVVRLYAFVFASINIFLMLAFSLALSTNQFSVTHLGDLMLSSLITIPFILLLLYIETLILFILAKVFGGTGTFYQTLTVVLFTTAISPLTALPYIGIAASLYGLYITVVGLQVVHKLKPVKAALVVLILFALVTGLLWYVFATYGEDIKKFINASLSPTPTVIPEESVTSPVTPGAGGDNYSEDYVFPTGYEDY